MTIEITSPDVEALIRQRMQTGKGRQVLSRRRQYHTLKSFMHFICSII